jgi:hypothetical protein
MLVLLDIGSYFSYRTLGSSKISEKLEQQILNAKALTEFLIIMLSASELEETAVQEIASSFVDALIKILNSQDEGSPVAANLRNSILMVLCVTQHAHSGRFDEDVWVLAAPHEARHLITAGNILVSVFWISLIL